MPYQAREDREVVAGLFRDREHAAAAIRTLREQRLLLAMFGLFAVVIVWSRPLGNRSSGTVLRSGSGLGIRAPFSDVVV